MQKMLSFVGKRETIKKGIGTPRLFLFPSLSMKTLYGGSFSTFWSMQAKMIACLFGYIRFTSFCFSLCSFCILLSVIFPFSLKILCNYGILARKDDQKDELPYNSVWV